MIKITKKRKVMIKNTLTKTKNYSKFKKEDLIKIINDFIKKYSFKNKTFFPSF